MFVKKRSTRIGTYIFFPCIESIISFVNNYDSKIQVQKYILNNFVDY